MKEKFFAYIKENYRETTIVLCITIFALMLRLIMLQNYGDLWLDEMYSWYFAHQKNVFLSVFELLKQDLHMPLYFIILHFWTKIFGQSDTSMHLCTLTLTLPLIPLSFYVMKSLFNKTSGYFVATLFAINTFGIYYSIEVRFYGLVFVLALLSAFLFVKMLEGFDKKYTLAFITVHLLLMYTFTITPILTFCYTLIGGVYVYNNKPEFIKQFWKNFGIVFAFAIPSILFTIYNYVVMHTTLCSFSKDIYVFSWNIIYDILENFFSSENFQIMTRNINVYRNMFHNVQNPFYFIFVFIPVLIGITGLLKSITVKNEKLYLFFFPSLLFFMFSMLLGSAGVFSFLTRYATIIYPVILCVACYGLSQFKIKKIGVGIFSIFILLNYLYIFLMPINIFTNPRKELGNLTQVMNDVIKPTDEDLILIPYSGSKVMRYVPKGTFIDFDADDGLLLKDNNSRGFYFDKIFYTNLNRLNIKSILEPYVRNNVPFELYEIRLKDFYFDKMKKGQKFIIISYRNSFTMPIILSWENLRNQEVYDSLNMFTFLMSKITKDSVQLANKYLKLVNEYTDLERDYSIFVYEKQ